MLSYLRLQWSRSRAQLRRLQTSSRCRLQLLTGFLIKSTRILSWQGQKSKRSGRHRHEMRRLTLTLVFVSIVSSRKPSSTCDGLCKFWTLGSLPHVLIKRVSRRIQLRVAHQSSTSGIHRLKLLRGKEFCLQICVDLEGCQKQDGGSSPHLVAVGSA